MQIPVNLDIVRLGRDPLQILSPFYNGVQKLEHFEDTNLTIMTREKALRDQKLGKKSPKLSVEAT